MVQSIKNLIAAILIAISGFLVWTQILPVYYSTASLKSTITEKEAILQSRTEILAKIKALNEEYNSRFTELQRLALVVPKSKGLPELVSMVEAIFSQTGNPITEFMIVDSSGQNELLKSMTVTMSSSGTYNSFYNLLKILETNIRLIDVESISVSEDLQAFNPEAVVTELKGEVYWLDQGVTENTPSQVPPRNGNE